MITMTKIAAERFKTILTEKSLPESTSMRVDLERGASGPDSVRLVLMLDPQEPQNTDKVTNTDGARVVVGEPAANALGNGEIDFREEEQSFVFRGSPREQ